MKNKLQIALDKFVAEHPDLCGRDIRMAFEAGYNAATLPDGPWERARRYARTHPQDKGAAPHYVRCLEFDDHERRCLFAAGHTEAHQFPK